MMTTLIISIFVLGYFAIAFEHPLKVNKTASALITGVLCWAVFMVFATDKEIVTGSLAHHLADISEILFFLLGAMTIVELIDLNNGFRFITDRITTKNATTLLWILCWIGFVLAAIIDNLAASIVMITLLRRLVKDANSRKIFGGMIIIAANAGGLWSPIGSITTTMLWIGERITPVNTILTLFIPSIINLLVPLVIFSLFLKGWFKNIEFTAGNTAANYNKGNALTMLITGFSALLFVPVFKTLTHLPPYVGMLLSLGLVWVVSELIHKSKDEELRQKYSAANALSKIDTPSILFFLGILLAIGALDTMGVLRGWAAQLDTSIGNYDIIALAIGLASAVVDNVPLVAATMSMYDLATFPADSKMWEFIAYCAGTGGSILIIGSAAGVAVMGMEKIDFIWYMKRISLLALVGYFAGAAVYLGIYSLLAH
ncbi:MAG: sodium:proton antiporter NhaD [Sphingobacteriales bacterium JAD_PAG50586_3]|nr:MAG: sodium:proton antiporter NhaD [Sphingobacteriales bacterium JAD_PAG50586_3]